MKKLTQTKFTIFVIAVLAAGFLTETLAQVRVESPPPKIMPKTSFDEAAAKKQLEPGNTTITGKGCGFFDGSRVPVAAGEITIHLYPDTPYIREWIKLGETNRWYGVSMVDAAFDNRIDALTDEAGRFKFTKIKPGKYYVQGYGKFNLSYSDGERDEVGKVLDGYIEIKEGNDDKYLEISNYVKQKKGVLGGYNWKC